MAAASSPAATDWTDGERSLFRALRPVHPANYCAIAAAMPTKTCRQVYEFHQHDDVSAAAERQHPPSPPPPPPKDRHKRFKRHAYRNGMHDHVINQSPYVPCDHDGPCTQQTCTCLQRRTLCEKFCRCSAACPGRFPGCRCRSNCRTKSCLCVMGGRECDPELCGGCGVDRALDRSRPVSPRACRNGAMQRGEGE